MEIESQYLRCFRGVPEIICSDFFNQRFIPPPFNDPACIRRIEFDKTMLPLYNKATTGTLLLLTWVIPGGMGDYYSKQFIYELLKKQCPEIEVHSLSIVHESQKNHCPDEQVICYKKHEELTTKPFIMRLQQALLPYTTIIQIPTYLPSWETLKTQFPFSTTIGEYGFIDSPWCHPMTGNRCLGLHGLEYGIMVKEWDNSTTETEKENFFAGYVVSERGYRLFVRGIAAFCKEKADDITLLLPSFPKWASSMKEDEKLLPFLKRQGIGKIEITVDNYYTEVLLQEKGKKLLLNHGKMFSRAELLSFFASSKNIIAVRGDQSFSEALMFDKPFFYDGAEHARPFIKDLIAIADEQIRIPSLSEFLRLSLKDPQIADKEWRDVRWMEEKEEDLDEKGMQFAILIKKPELQKGFHKLREWITSHHNANEYLIAIVRRMLVHEQRKDIAHCEEKLLTEYCIGDIDLQTAKRSLQQRLRDII